MHARLSRPWSVVALVAASALLVQTAPVAGAESSPATTPEAASTTGVAGLDPTLRQQFAESTTAEFWVDLREEADLTKASRTSGWAALGSAVAHELKSTARESQADLLALLERRNVTHEPFWISNAVLVTGTKPLAEELADRPEVAGIRPTRSVSIPEPSESAAAAQNLAWNIEQVRADEVWGRYGVRGEGIVVASIDTGADFHHPALVRQYRGNLGNGEFDHDYDWFDPSEVCGSPSLEPCDNHFHGTHTIGTMLGDDGTNVVGVAPNATWISAKGCETRNCSDEALLASAQWMLAPTDLRGQNPRPDLRPHIVNNSWGDVVHDPFFVDAVDAWIAAGIFPVFSAGNEGPDCGTVGSPGDYDTAYSVGSHNRNGAISSFSSRGPASETSATKPDIAAPGASVTSSVPGGGYGSASGTSMAAPHVAGTVALMWSAAPSLQRDIAETRRILDQTAINVEDLQCGGTADDNHVWGEGRLDTMLAVSASPLGATGILTGTVTDAETGDPLPGVRVDLSTTVDRTVWTDDAGGYRVELAEGAYELSASVFAYETTTIRDVTVVADTTVVRDVELSRSPTVVLQGTVTDPAGQPVAGATVRVEGTPIPGMRTDAEGRYAFEPVPAGAYDVHVTGTGCLGAVTKAVTLEADTTLDFSLPRLSDEFGYHCVERPASYLLPTQEVPLEARTARIELPFPFTFYGETYTAVNIAEPGFVNFGRSHPSFRNFPIPHGDWPNASIYPFWDDISVTSGSHVYTGTFGEAPNRRVVIDWRNVAFFFDESGDRFDAQVVLHENGDIVTQYRGLDSEREHGGSATVGIENADGTVGFQYSNNQAVLADGVAIHFGRPPNGFATGAVTDSNDGQPVRGAEVTVLDDGVPIRDRLTDGAGGFKIEVPTGTYEVRISSPRYVTATRALTVDTDDEYVDVSASLRTARASVGGGPRTVVVPHGESRTRSITIANTGDVDLEWEVLESDRPSAGPAGPPTGVDATATGELVRRWRVDNRPDLFGVGIDGDGDVWLGGLAIEDSNTEYTVDGTPTGREWPTTWARTWAADMAYDPTRGLMCQVEIGGDNGIDCWDPDTGEVTAAILGDFAWTEISQRGLAYRSDDDSFYIGGFLDGVVFHVAGLSHDKPGAVIDSCRPSDPNISGLGWNPATGTLWVATHSPDDLVYELDPTTCSVISTLAHPRPGLHGGGLEVDPVGNVWMVDRDTHVAYLFDAGSSALVDVPWLTASGQGSVAPAESGTVEVTIDTSGLAPGVYDASILVASNSGRDPYLSVPIRLVVPAYYKAFNAGGAEHTDRRGDTWQADRAYGGGGTAGWTGKESWVMTKNKDIAGTTDDSLYLGQRVDLTGYTFDGLPDGVYEVDLRFAELVMGMKPGKRRVDVYADDQLLLDNHDIADEVGPLNADAHTFQVTVDDGHLNLRFDSLEREVVVNAVRLTHRPDW